MHVSNAKRVKRAKQVVSMLLAVMMVFSLVSVELSTVVAGNATVTQSKAVTVTAPPSVSVSATRVARVAAAQNSFQLGTTLVRATPSGVPDIGSATYANAAYAGETTAWPSASVTFPPGISPDAVPGVTFTASTVSGSVSLSAVSKDGQTYSASVTGGSAIAGNNIVYQISYNIDGTTYTVNAYSYVENIVVPSGIQYFRKANDNIFGGTAGLMYVNYRYLGEGVYGQEVTGSAEHGYYNFPGANFASNPPTPYNTQLRVARDGGTTRYHHGGYTADANRPQVRAYMDTSVHNSLADMNFRIGFFMYDDLGTYSTDNRLTATYVQAGNVQSVSGEDSDSPPAVNQTASDQLGITGQGQQMNAKGDSFNANFTGPGPSASGTVYTVTMLTQAPPDSDGNYTLSGYTSAALTIYKYDKGALRTRINNIVSGAAGKGINPQPWYYTAGWEPFRTAFDEANRILNKPNTNQSEINTALSNLNSAYSSLVERVFTYSINSYIKGTTTPIIPAVTGTGAYSGYILIAIAENIPGYVLDPFDASPARITLTPTSYEINFYYTARNYTLNFVSNGGTEVSSVTQGYQTLVQKPNDPTQTHYVFNGWYLDPDCTQLVTWPFKMPLGGATLYAHWILAPVTLTFNSNNGTPIAPVTATPRTLVEKPADPTRNNFIFEGWYYDIVFTEPVEWPLTLPYNNLMIYAKWIYVQYTVSFNSNGGTTVGAITASPGTPIYPPNPPVRTGFEFGGWYYDNDTFQNPVEWPIILETTGFQLHARWIAQGTVMSFDTQGGTEIAPIIAPTGTPVSAPTPPRRFGFVFDGWRHNGNPYTFTTMPASDITLVAAWTATPRAVQADLDVYKEVGGEFMPVTQARVGDIITVTLTPRTNFYTGSTRFIIMYDTSFYSIVGVNAGAITPNPDNAYFANAISSYSGATSSPISQWPNTFVDGESGQYKFVAANFNASAASVNKGYPVIINDGSWLFRIKLQVKADAQGSGHIFMDSRWDRSVARPTGAQYFFFCPNATTLSSAGNSVLDFYTDYIDANETILLDTSVSQPTNIVFDSNGGSHVPTISGEPGATVTPPPDPVREGYTFLGWSPAVPGVFPVTDIVLSAGWQINTYNAIFMVDGEEYATVPTLYGGMIDAPTDPEKTGFTFVGWSPEADFMGAQDRVFTALFQVNIYDAIFMVDGQQYAVVPTEYNAAIVLPTAPLKVGYTFNGWSPEVGTMPASDRTFTAQFSINTYTASFFVDGELVASVPTVYGQPIVPPADPEKVNNEFLGWSPQVGTMEAGDMTFIAQWFSLVYFANFMVDGVLYAQFEIGIGEPIELPANPSKVGHTFRGWDYIPDEMPASDVTITATWSVNSYDAVFRVNGALLTVQRYAFGATIVPPSNPPAPPNYVFAGWTNFPIDGKMPAQNLTLHAIFEPQEFMAYFMVDDEVYAAVPTPFETEIVPPANPTKTGHNFTGWSSIPALMPANDVYITAQFTINSYSVRFLVDGEEYDSITSQYGAPVNLPAPPQKFGFTFTGWDNVPQTMPATDLDVNAVFTKNVHFAIFMVDGGIYSMVPTGYNETIILPPIPSKEGYAFAQWLNIPQAMPDEDVVINGTWTVNSYDVLFLVDGDVYEYITVEFGAEIPLPTAPTKPGEFFAGWSPEVPDTMPAYSLEFNAEWTLDISSTVTFDLNGGTGTIPSAQHGDNGTPVELPAQGDIARPYYNFLGWATSPDATQPLAAFDFGAQDVTLYAVWSRVPVTLAAKDASTTVVDDVNGFIYGLEEGLTRNAFINNYVQVLGDGEVRVTLAGDSFGTGTKVELIDRTSGTVINTYYIVIFGDVDGDGYITGSDANLIAIATQSQTVFENGSAYAFAADFTGDETIDADDLAVINAATSYIGTIDQVNPQELI